MPRLPVSWLPVEKGSLKEFKAHVGDAKPKPERAGNNTVLRGSGDVDPRSQEEPGEKPEVLKELIHQALPRNS